MRAASRAVLTPAVPRAVRQPLPVAASRCRRWRHIGIGTAIGAAVAAPLAALAHRRFENEAADGGPAAAWTMGLGAAAGALIANATCDR